MRRIMVVLAGVGLTGCVAHGPVEPIPVERGYAEAQAAALVFDPPVAMGQAPLMLERPGRAEAAFWGLEGPSVTYHYTRTEDRFGTGHWGGFDGDHYRRRSVSVRYGTSYR